MDGIEPRDDDIAPSSYPDPMRELHKKLAEQLGFSLDDLSDLDEELDTNVSVDVIVGQLGHPELFIAVRTQPEDYEPLARFAVPSMGGLEAIRGLVAVAMQSFRSGYDTGRRHGYDLASRKIGQSPNR